MRKLFFAICFIIFSSTLAKADVTTLDEAAQNRSTPQNSDPFQPVDGMPDPKNLEEVISFFKKRFENANISTLEEMGDLSKPGAMDIQHSAEYISDLANQKKSTFEKIYDAAMQRISGEKTQNNTEQTLFYNLAQNNFEQQLAVPTDFPVVDVVLPTGNKIMAPAMEHIPYILTSINILPTGLVKVDEEITVIANNQKLQNGFVKVLPKFSTSRTKVKKKLDIDLINVSINGENVAHILEEIGDKIYIKPIEKYTLAPGVYNYKFSYFLDRKLWYYNDFTEFYWDVTGSYLNLVIGSANAIVSVADGKSFLSQSVLTGYNKRLSSDRAVIANLDSNALGFASTTPILPGEGMHILVSLDKNTFLSPDINRSFVWFVTDFGDMLFATFGLLAILGAYILSWAYIKKNKSKTGAVFNNSAAGNRYFLTNNFDAKSFVGFLLEMKKKQYIDIQKQENNILLIKKTDNLSALKKGEKKALNQLFSGKDSVISAGLPNALKFKRAYKELEKSIVSAVKFFSLKLNIGYLVFSVLMLLLSTVAIAMLAINPIQTGVILVSSIIAIAFYTHMLRKKFNSKIVSYIVKFFSSAFIVFSVLLMSVYIHFVSAVILAAIVYIIFEYSTMFIKRGGLLKNKIKDIEKLKSYLESNVSSISISQEFANQQANIYVFELDNLFTKTDKNKKHYLLDVAKEIENIL
ncbi:MAG: DUF2207 domain-containing protein [Alphaproteobacteria bacterium]|nr:DUF2207 domain-containing protein [Alphaproteobacteria bacterium]